MTILDERTVDWLIWPIYPAPEWATQVPPVPDLVEIARGAARGAGHDPKELDEVTMMRWMLGVFITYTELMLASLERSEDSVGLRTVMMRQDLRFEDPWNYLTWLGADGVAVYRRMVEVMGSDDVRQALIARIDSHEFDDFARW